MNGERTRGPGRESGGEEALAGTVGPVDAYDATRQAPRLPEVVDLDATAMGGARAVGGAGPRPAIGLDATAQAGARAVGGAGPRPAIGPDATAQAGSGPDAAAREIDLDATTLGGARSVPAGLDLEVTTLGASPAAGPPAAPEPDAPLERTRDRPVAWKSGLRDLLFGRSRPAATEDLGETDVDGPVGPPTGRPVLDGTQQRIGRFAILRKLGEGGMGEVFSAYDEELDRRVAIKLVRDERSGDTIGHSRLQREAQALARLSHPNVVQVYDVGAHGDQVFIAMEFVRGRTLTEWEAAIDAGTPAGQRRILDMYIQAGQGLAAAHQRELVHRDFKPDNVLVGDDGRPRVVDFGLAAAADARREGGGKPVDPAAGGLLSSDLTRTGSVMGTPAYMAPEQFLAEPSDARTDQFSFCVALYDALYRDAPFAGETFAARQASVCRGEVKPAPAGARVPTWLRALLLRGMQVRPQDRHPSMDALLAALAHDPDEARRRRLRRAAVVVALIGAGALVLWGGLAGWSAWQRHRLEAVAEERLATMEANAAAATAAGDEAEAERLFSAFARLPAHRGTVALAQAWRRRAEREAAAGRYATALDAHAAAYAVATAEAEQVAALGALARFFARQQSLDGLSRSVAVLERRVPRAFADPELAGLRADAAIARGDLRAAEAALAGEASREPLRRLVAALAPAHKTPHSTRTVGGELLIDGDERLLVRPRESVTRLRADLDMTEIARYPTTLDEFVVLDRGGGAPIIYIGWDAELRENVILELQPGGLIERGRWADFAVVSQVIADLDGDGVKDILVGTGPYSRHALQLVPAADGSFTTRAVAPTLDARRSDVWSLDAADLDGDGVSEIVAGLGAWRAYEVHVLRHDPARGLLGTVARHRLGFVGAAVRGRGGASPSIIAWKSNNDMSPLAFPADTPRGAPPGLYVLRLVGDRLEPGQFLPAPPDSTDTATRPLIGDLDGDGREEIVVRRRMTIANELREASLVFFEDGARGLAGVCLPDVSPVALHDLDGDGDRELLVLDGDKDLWVVGAGEAALPVRRAAQVAVGAAPADAGASAGAWRQAEELAEMGLAPQAADAFVDLAESVGLHEPRLAARALLRAGQLYEGLGRDEAAATLLARAAADPELAEEAGLAAVRAFIRRGERGQARALLDELRGRRGLTDAAARALAAARAELGDVDARLDLDFSQPLDRRWRIHQPLALVRDAPSASLHVDKIGANVIASLPVTWGEGPTSIEVEVDIRRVEWGEDLQIGLAPPGGRTAMSVSFGTRGGQGDVWFDLRCGSRDHPTAFPERMNAAGRDGPGRVVFRAVFDPGRREGSCSIRGADGRELRYQRLSMGDDVGLGREAELVIDSGGTANLAGWISADIRRIAVVGATLREGDAPGPLARLEHTLVEGHLGEALAVLDDPAALAGVDARTRVRATFWRISALARMGRFADAAAALRAVLADPALEDLYGGPLRLFARTMPDMTMALLRSAGPPGMHRTWMVDAWGPALQMRADDVLALQVLRRTLTDMVPANVEPARRAELFSVRARVHALLRMPARARADYEVALGYLADAEIPPGEDREAILGRLALTWSLDLLAAMVAEGDVAGAQARLEGLLAAPNDRATIRDVLDTRPELAPLRAAR